LSHRPGPSGRTVHEEVDADTGAEAVKLDPGSSWEGHSGGVGADVGDENASLVGLSAHSAFHWLSAHCAARMLLLLDELMGCCAAGTSGCLDLKRRASALGGRVSAE